jgi:two-component system, cell cycle sensor histidine kinase and response regulator CckA
MQSGDNADRSESLVHKLGQGLIDRKLTPSEPPGPRITQNPPSGGAYPDSGVQFRGSPTPSGFGARERQDQQKAENVAWLTAGFSHDLNNLLVGVLGNADLALAAVLRGGDPVMHLRAIRAAAERAAELTGSMLRIASNRERAPSPVDLVRLVDETVMIAKAGVGRAIQVIDTAPASAGTKRPIQVVGEPGRLSQVILNLVINGAEALGPKGGEVNVVVTAVETLPLVLMERPTTTAEHGYAKIMVSDTGAGMDATTLARVFEPFYSTKSRGQGLGLATTLAIVRDYNGALGVSSRVGAGTTFEVYLPLHPTNEQSLAASSSDLEAAATLPAWRTSGKVLVVDDEPMVARLTAMVLEHLGMETHVERSAPDALTRIKQSHEQGAPFRLVVVDWTMPELSGFEMWQQLRAAFPELALVVTSGFTEQRVAAEWTPDEHSGFLQKPYRMTAIIDVLKAVLHEG